MPDRISTEEKDWRYLAEQGWTAGPSSFGRLLVRLGIALPEPLHQLVTLGWIRPRLRVILPAEFFTSWTNFPLYNREGAIPAGLEWAELLIFSETIPCRKNQPLSERWYEHYLDQHDDPEVQAIWANAIPEDSLQEPPPEVAVGPFLIKPTYNLYAYWQAYELIDVLPATELFQPIRNTPEAGDNLRDALTRLDSYQTYSTSRIAEAQHRWRQLADVFEWLSRYRTLCGFWLFHERLAHRATWQAGSQSLAQQLELTPDRLRTDIRDHLLVLWKNWASRPDIPDGARGLLRQDIHRAFEFLGIVSGAPVDFTDPFWDPPDRQPRAWAVPDDVLPFELTKARQLFPLTAPTFLEPLNAVLPAEQRFTRDRLTALLNCWWVASRSLRRFLVHVHRLHQTGSTTTDDNPVTFEASTPVDQLILVTGSTERLLLERYLQRKGGQVTAPGFRELLLDTMDTITTNLSIPSIRDELMPLLKETGLYDLTLTIRNPFAKAKNLPSGTLRAELTAAAFNFATMRNYGAHHDVLDDELISQNWGREPLDALHIVAVLLLAADA
jgi:hypothetical protein